MSLTQPLAEPIDDAFIGRRVHQLMWDSRMTQTELGAMLGMDQSTIAKRLRGRVGWPATLLVRTASALGTSVAYLVGETDIVRPEDDTTDYGGVDSPSLAPVIGIFSKVPVLLAPSAAS